MHVVGHSRDGLPVIYSCLDLAGDKTPEATRDHMIMTFEQVTTHVNCHCILDHRAGCMAALGMT